jgi:predicted chitinase
MAGAAALAGSKSTQSPQSQVPPTPPPQTKLPTTPSEHKSYLTQYAQKMQMSGSELQQFIAQCAHETLNFARLTEAPPTGNSDPQRYFNKKYDPSLNPRKAKILGNTQPGDGYKFRGRGYLQITGRWNYTACSAALAKMGITNDPQLLVNNPNIVATNPKIAAASALWFWNHRVKPRVTDMTNVQQVTKKINPGMRGLRDRVKKFNNQKQ